jgi:outer membrane protein OmpA-like peptidoglycan-associated protein
MTLKMSLFLSAFAVLAITSASCATKKHVRESIAPVQNQVNQIQTQVNTLQKQSDENRQAIGDLDRQVATANEKAIDANKKAAQAADAATRADNAATEAGRRADAADSLARQAQQGVTRVNQRMEESFANLDNFKLAFSEQVYFGFDRSSLRKQERAKLENAILKIDSTKNYLIEVEGFADSTGGTAYNRELSRKRADTVVHVLAVEHNVPLRAIREVGAGEDFPNANNRTVAARKENRRVDVKIYTRELSGAVAAVTVK